MTTTATGFSSLLADLHLVPLWHLDDEILPPQPTPSAEPSLWLYPDVRRALLDSVAVADGEVERRVLLNRSASDPAFLVALTDEPALRALGFYRRA